MEPGSQFSIAETLAIKNGNLKHGWDNRKNHHGEGSFLAQILLLSTEVYGDSEPRKVRNVRKENTSSRVVSHQSDAVTSLGDALEMLDVLSHLFLYLLSLFLLLMGCGA
jgi:hypothetical protein